MGTTIQFDNHRVELATVYELEHDADVLEYFDQPPYFKLEYASWAGRNIGVFHTADYFAIRKASAGWEECKTREELVQLSSRTLTATDAPPKVDGLVHLERRMPKVSVFIIGFARRHNGLLDKLR